MDARQRDPSLSGRVAVVMLGLWLGALLFWWAFAFARLPDASPEWLVRARAVCFRTLESGLPDPTGWMMLIAPPAAMLGVLVVGWARELRAGLTRLVGTTGGRALVAVVLVVCVVEGAWVATHVTEGLEVSRTWSAAGPREPGPATQTESVLPIPDFELVDQRGRPFSADHLREHVHLVTFAFAHCETICPLTIRTVREAADSLEPRPPVVVITVDPWRDTPNTTAGAADRWGLAEGDVFASGAVDVVLETLDGFRVPVTRDTTDGMVTHPALVAVTDPRGDTARVFANPSGEWIRETVRRARQSP